MKPTDLIYVLYYVLLIFWMDGLGYFFDRVVVRLMWQEALSWKKKKKKAETQNA